MLGAGGAGRRTMGQGLQTAPAQMGAGSARLPGRGAEQGACPAIPRWLVADWAREHAGRVRPRPWSGSLVYLASWSFWAS